MSIHVTLPTLLERPPFCQLLCCVSCVMYQGTVYGPASGRRFMLERHALGLTEAP